MCKNKLFRVRLLKFEPMLTMESCWDKLPSYIPKTIVLLAMVVSEFPTVHQHLHGGPMDGATCKPPLFQEWPIEYCVGCVLGEVMKEKQGQSLMGSLFPSERDFPQHTKCWSPCAPAIEVLSPWEAFIPHTIIFHGCFTQLLPEWVLCPKDSFALTSQEERLTSMVSLCFLEPLAEERGL